MQSLTGYRVMNGDSPRLALSGYNTSPLPTRHLGVPAITLIDKFFLDIPVPTNADSLYFLCPAPNSSLMGIYWTGDLDVTTLSANVINSGTIPNSGATAGGPSNFRPMRYSFTLVNAGNPNSALGNYYMVPFTAPITAGFALGTTAQTMTGLQMRTLAASMLTSPHSLKRSGQQLLVPEHHITFPVNDAGYHTFNDFRTANAGEYVDIIFRDTADATVGAPANEPGMVMSGWAIYLPRASSAQVMSLEIQYQARARYAPGTQLHSMSTYQSVSATGIDNAIMAAVSSATPLLGGESRGGGPKPHKKKPRGKKTGFSSQDASGSWKPVLRHDGR